jgi:thiamine pyrophosphokinase
MDMSDTRNVVIITGGLPLDPRAVAALAPQSFVIAADSGYDHAVRNGIDVDLLVGDLDSLSADGLAHAQRTGVPIERYPTDKDSTDAELALAAALGRGFDQLTVITGGSDRRIDHLLGNVFMFAEQRCTMWIGPNRVRMLVGPDGCRIGAPTVSLLAARGDAYGVSTTGLRWPLLTTTLTFGSTLGLSNERIAASATVTVERGTLIAIESWDDN